MTRGRGDHSGGTESPHDSRDLCIRVERPEGLRHVGIKIEILVLLEPLQGDLGLGDTVQTEAPQSVIFGGIAPDQIMPCPEQHPVRFDDTLAPLGIPCALV